MKKRLLFVIDSLVGAGAEKSLITLLSLLDYNKYSADLMLFAHGELLEKLVPKEVNILEPLRYTTFSNLNLVSAFHYSLREKNFSMLRSRLNYSYEIRVKKYSNPQKAQAFWHYGANVIEANPNEYDVAISYAQGIPTFYVAKKVHAKKKFAWVNVSYRLDKKDAEYQEQFYKEFTKIVTVSNSAKQIFLDTFPMFTNKTHILYDINDPNFIEKMANTGEAYKDNFDGIRILTIGRLAYQKGYDIALDACRKLKEQGIKFRWYVLGKGPLQKEIEQYIAKHDLHNHFVLLGITANPYPFIKNSDIYVQTSRFEGFGLAIAEARMLNIPVVTTRFDAVYSQMIDERNGLVVDMRADKVYEGILTLIQNNHLKNSIISFLKTEQKGNLEELDKFYELIG